jgi:hypothetical protein
MTTILFHFIQRKEEDSKETSNKHSKMRRLHRFQVIIREEIFQRSSASNVTNMDIVVVLIHTCKRELSPAHLVCPRRHNA